ncbi:3636_t:CDS:2, partial [Acaulospora morrowiae]
MTIDLLEIHIQLVNAWDQSAPSLVTVWCWIHNFKEGREDLNDNSQSGRPREA